MVYTKHLINLTTVAVTFSDLRPLKDSDLRALKDSAFTHWIFQNTNLLIP